jgi:trans-aconitate methyltransferase
VVATDLDIDFLDAHAAADPGLEVRRDDITAEELPGGFDLVHTRWLVEWLPDTHLALRRMMSALRPGDVLRIEEPDVSPEMCHIAVPPRALGAESSGRRIVNAPSGVWRVRSAGSRRRLPAFRRVGDDRRPGTGDLTVQQL